MLLEDPWPPTETRFSHSRQHIFSPGCLDSLRHFIVLCKIKSPVPDAVNAGPEHHLEFLWRLFWAVWLALELSVSLIGHQFFMSREVGISPVHVELVNNVSNSSHSNIKLLGGDPIAFMFNLLVYNFSFLRQLFSFLLFSVVKTVSTNRRVTTWQPINGQTNWIEVWRCLWC